MASTAAGMARKYRAAVKAAAVCADTGRDCPIDGNSCEPGAHLGMAIDAMATESIYYIPELTPRVAAAIGYAGRIVEAYVYEDSSVLAYCDDGNSVTECWVVRGKYAASIQVSARVALRITARS